MSMCRVFSCVVEEGVCYDQCILLAKLYWPLPCFILYSKARFACYSRCFLTSYFCIPVPYNEKDTIESVMLYNYFIFNCSLLLLSLIFPSIRVFSNESSLLINDQSIGVSASTSVLPMNIQDWSPLEWRSVVSGCISLQSKELSRIFSNTTVQRHQFFGTQLSSQSNSHIHTWPLGKNSLD